MSIIIIKGSEIITKLEINNRHHHHLLLHLSSHHRLNYLSICCLDAVLGARQPPCWARAAGDRGVRPSEPAMSRLAAWLRTGVAGARSVTGSPSSASRSSVTNRPVIAACMNLANSLRAGFFFFVWGRGDEGQKRKSAIKK